MSRLLSIVVALAVATSSAAAQAHPDLSGTWALDRASVPASAQLPPDAKLVLQVKQDEKTLTLDLLVSVQGTEQKRTTTANLDGSSSKNSLATPMGSLDMMSTLAWEGPVAVVTSKGEVQGQAFVETDKFSLDPDGKRLRYEANISAGALNQTNKLVFIKQ